MVFITRTHSLACHLVKLLKLFKFPKYKLLLHMYEGCVKSLWTQLNLQVFHTYFSDSQMELLENIFDKAYKSTNNTCTWTPVSQHQVHMEMIIIGSIVVQCSIQNNDIMFPSCYIQAVLSVVNVRTTFPVDLNFVFSILCGKQYRSQASPAYLDLDLRCPVAQSYKILPFH